MYSTIQCFQPLVLSMAPGARSGGQQNAVSLLRKTVNWPNGRRAARRCSKDAIAIKFSSPTRCPRYRGPRR